MSLLPDPCLEPLAGPCPHRLVREEEIVEGDKTLYLVAVCEDCGEQLDPEGDEL